MCGFEHCALSLQKQFCFSPKSCLFRFKFRTLLCSCDRTSLSLEISSTPEIFRQKLFQPYLLRPKKSNQKTLLKLSGFLYQGTPQSFEIEKQFFHHPLSKRRHFYKSHNHRRPFRQLKRSIKKESSSNVLQTSKKSTIDRNLHF